MEDLASFIQTLSEKYGLLEFGNDKVDSTDTNHFQQKSVPTGDEEQEDHSQENGDSLGVDTSWECLTSFLNKHDLQYTNMHNFRTKKSSMSKRRERNGQLPHEDQGDDVEEAQTLDRPESGSSNRAVSLANTIQTSDLIQNASFLDELHNPSLSEDLQSTGMTRGRDSLDDSDHGQSSILQEFLTGNGEKDVDVVEFAKEMGLSSFNECPQKEDAPWHANSDAWFREFCSTRNDVTSSSQRSARMDTKVAEKVCLDRGLLAHDILASNDILLSSGSFSSPTGTELDGQVEDCHSASALQCGADATVARSRCVSPEGFAAALESVERGRERAAIVNARVEKMLEESDSHHSRGFHHAVETAGGKSINRVQGDKYPAEDAGKMSELRFGPSENGSVGSLKQRMVDMDEENRLLLIQLDKSRSLLSPSKQPALFRSHSSGSNRIEVWRQSRRSTEEVGNRPEQNDTVSLRQLDEGGKMMLSRHSQGKVLSSHEDDPHSRASSRGERDYRPVCGALSTQEEDSGHGAKASSHYPSQRRTSSSNQEVDHQPSIALPVDHLHRFNTKRDSSEDRHIGRNLRIHIPNFELPADQYDLRNADGQDLSENQEGIYSSRETFTQDHQSQYKGSLAVSPRNRESDDYEEIRDGREAFEAGQPGLADSGRNHQDDEGFCARTKDYYNFSSSWGKEWTKTEEEVIETIDPTPSGTSVGQSKWERVNNLLCRNGFSTIRSSNVPASDFEEDCHLLLSDVVSNYERREKFVHALLEEGDELRQVEERNHLHIQQLENGRDEVKQKLAASERRAEVAAKVAERNYAALRRDCQKLESSNANLMQRCSQLEHACRAKERTLQKLQDKVRESMVKEDRHRSNDKDAYEKLKHRVASAQHTNGEALEPNFLQRDLKPVQIVGIYERQKVALETEISNLRAENAQLCREICEKENIILNKVLGTEETKKALDLLSRKQQLQIDEKIKEICRLEDELKERPTMKEVEETIRSASRDEEASRQFHVRVQDESYFEKILRQICQILELDEPSFIIETLESLLVLISAVPRMEQFVSDVCDVVFCNGQNWSSPSNDEGTGVNRIAEAVPGILKSWVQKLEESSELLTFKDTIVGMLWERADKNSELEPEMSCRVVIGCVKNLIEVEQDYLATKASYRLEVFDTASIFAPLLTWKSLKNVDIVALPKCSYPELSNMGNLRHTLRTHPSYHDADAIVKAEPQKLLHRIVAHFQMLFEVPKVEGVMAVMNSAYIKCTEYHNFARALSSMLGLDKEEGPNTIISTVNSIMSHERM